MRWIFINAVLVPLLLALNGFTHCSCISIVDFEQPHAGWEIAEINSKTRNSQN